MASEFEDGCALFFVKSPLAGAVKTRLAAEIGERHARALYRHFVEDSAAMLKRCDVDFRFCFWPDDSRDDFVKWLGEGHDYQAQVGRNLGERMKNAFERLFEEGFSKVVVVGSDIPDLPERYLKDAFSVLGFCDAVIGPSRDGGYYLIGFSRKGFLPEAFDNIAWGSDSVFEHTAGILEFYEVQTHVLPLWSDVDTLADLRALVERNEDGAFAESRTLGYVRENKLWSQRK